MGVPNSLMVQNAYEQLLSGDVVRLQKLSSRDLQNLIRGYGIDRAGLPISGIVGPLPTLTGIVASFDMDFSAAGGFMESAVGVGADDSSYQVLRWAGQAVTFAIPDAGFPRIDLVVATPAIEQADPVPRNILTDPILRTVVSTSVNKTQNPKSTIAVVTGVAGATPAPPATPAGAVVVMEVLVPAGVADSTFFRPVNQLFRLAPAPLSTISAVISGCALQWPGTTTPSFPRFRGTHCAALIDGEIVEWDGEDFGAATSPVLSGDGLLASNPFDIGNAAPVTNDQPFYVYLVGGRHSPQVSGTSTSPRAPVALVASLIQPNPATGRPLSDITPPRGAPTTDGALYVGLGFTEAGSSSPKPCIMEGDWVIGKIEVLPGLETISLVGPFGTGLGVTFVGRPAISTRAKIGLAVQPVASSGSHTVEVANASGAFSMIQLRAEGFKTAAADLIPGSAFGEIMFDDAAPQLAVFDSEVVEADTVQVTAVGYEHRAPRVDGNAALKGR